MPKTDLTIHIELYGESHNVPPQESDVNMLTLEFLQKLQKSKWQINQCRFTSGRGEENWLDGVTKSLHEGLHDELVRLGEEANALRKPSTAGVGSHEGGDKGSGGTSKGEGVGPGQQGQKPAPEKESGKEKEPAKTHAGRS